MKEFEFDDIEISDEKEEVKEEKKENLKEDPLYQKFSFDIDSDSDMDIDIKEEEEIEEKEEKEDPIIEEVDLDQNNLNDLFEDKDEVVEEKPLFSNTNLEIDNPFVEKKVVEEVKISEEEQVENMYKEANKNIKPVISFDEKELENKEDALEEALSHTTKFSPFKESKPEVSDLEIEETKETKEKNGIAYLIALFVILLIAIFVIPKIAALF